MTDETAREIAERETGRIDDRRERPERRSKRTGAGGGKIRRPRSAAKGRGRRRILRRAPDKTTGPFIQTGETSAADQRRFDRV